MKRVAVALLVLAAGVVVGGELVAADAPVKQGWWSRWQVDPAGSPLPPAVPVTPTLPAPPTGDEGGLTVAHGPDGPTAIAAMYFTVEASVDATLYLEAAPKQKAGPEPADGPDGAPHPDTIVLPDGATVLACTALSAWDGEVNGPWSKVPTWDAAGCAPGTVTSDGTAMFWTLSSAMQDLDENYDIVLVPTGPPPTPAPPPEGAPSPPGTTYMVNFASPGADTLVTEDLPDEETTTTTTTGPEVDPYPPVDPGVFVPPTGGFMTPTTMVQRTPTSLVAVRRPSAPTTRTAFRLPDSRRDRIMAVSMLLAMAGALWWLGGNPSRGPRLIGAAAGRTPGERAVEQPLSRGVGRFARPRGGRVPRL